ncbi:MAG: hypothetical protein AAFZ52_04380 [Bacteroidota bacterium]
MHPVQKYLFATNFRDLAGAKLEGTLALSDEIVNLGLGELLLALKTTSATPGADATHKTSSPSPDPKALAGLLEVEELQYRTEKGRTLVDIKTSLKP